MLFKYCLNDVRKPFFICVCGGKSYRFVLGFGKCSNFTNGF